MSPALALVRAALVICCLSCGPVGSLDMTFRVSNSLQCRRLCWYWTSCSVFAFLDKAYHQGWRADACVIRANSGQGANNCGQGTNNGWAEEGATSAGLPADHGCVSRPCNDTLPLCVPMVTAGPTTSLMCVDKPS